MVSDKNYCTYAVIEFWGFVSSLLMSAYSCTVHTMCSYNACRSWTYNNGSHCCKWRGRGWEVDMCKHQRKPTHTGEDCCSWSFKFCAQFYLCRYKLPSYGGGGYNPSVYCAYYCWLDNCVIYKHWFMSVTHNSTKILCDLKLNCLFCMQMEMIFNSVKIRQLFTWEVHRPVWWWWCLRIHLLKTQKSSLWYQHHLILMTMLLGTQP